MASKPNPHEVVGGVSIGSSTIHVTLRRTDDDLQRATSSKPLAVAFTDHGMLFGQAALEQQALNPTNTIVGLADLIGLEFTDRDAQRAVQTWLPRLVPGNAGEICVEVQLRGEQKRFSVCELMSMLIGDALHGAGLTKGHIVVTFDAPIDNQRFTRSSRCLKDAAAIAGYNAARVTSTRIAAVFGAGLLDRTAAQELATLVVKVGAAHVRTDLVLIEDGICEHAGTTILSRNGAAVGGDAVDDGLVETVLETLTPEIAARTRGSHRSMLALRLACRSAKETITRSHRPSISIAAALPGSALAESEEPVPEERHSPVAATADCNAADDCDDPPPLSTAPVRFTVGGETVDAQITAADIARCAAPTVDAVTSALTAAVSDRAPLAYVIIHGGSAPSVAAAVQDLLTGPSAPSRPAIELFLSEPPPSVGAAGIAVSIHPSCSRLSDCVLGGHSAPLTIGVEGPGGVMVPVIPRNTSFPVRRSCVLPTTVDGQTEMVVKVFEGERHMVADNHHLASVTVTPIPAAPAQDRKVEVTLTLDAHCTLQVLAAEPLGGASASTVVAHGTTRLTASEIDALLARAAEYEAEDRIELKRIQARHELEMVIAATRKVADSPALVDGRSHSHSPDANSERFETCDETSAPPSLTVTLSDRDRLRAIADECWQWLDKHQQSCAAVFSDKLQEVVARVPSNAWGAVDQVFSQSTTPQRTGPTIDEVD